MGSGVADPPRERQGRTGLGRVQRSASVMVVLATRECSGDPLSVVLFYAMLKQLYRRVS